METIQMKDVVPLLPLPPPPNGKSSYYAQCPHCDSSGKDKHLNINLYKNVFRCPRCGWNGGIFDLYAYFTSTPRAKVRDELVRILKMDVPKPKIGSNAVGTQLDRLDGSGLQAADITIRHAAYNALLNMLSLAPDHKSNLINRGLSEQAIAKNGYKTTPMVGTRLIAKRLLESGLQLEGVPGFYMDEDGSWTITRQKRGIYIPVRDEKGFIQGLQIRRDNVSRRKYRWLSSSGLESSACGCGAEGWIHLAGPVREKVILIEGALKADIVHHLTGCTVIALPGVNSIKHLGPALQRLTECGMDHLMTAFDMDFLKNPHVRNGYEELVALLRRLHVRYGTYLWYPGYNGLDDYVFARMTDT